MSGRDDGGFSGEVDWKAACKPERKDGGDAVAGYVFRQDNQGFVLISTLGIMAVLAVLAWSFVFNARVEVKISSWQQQRLEAYYTARSGLQRTAALLAAHKEEEANGPSSPWWSDEAQYHHRRTGGGEYTIRPFPGRETESKTKRPETYGVSDEESLLNINVATPEMLMQFDGINSVLAEEILLYRAKQSNEENEPKQDAETISSPIRDIRELLQIHGMNRDILFGGPHGGSRAESRLGRNITCYSSGKINVNTARPMVLTSLGFSEESLRAIQLFRAEGQNAQSVDSFLNQMRVNRELIQKNIPLLTVKSTHFRMTSSATIRNKVSTLSISARCDLLKEGAIFSLWQIAHDGGRP